MLYHIAGTFEGENFREFRSFVAICESFFHEIWEHDVLWCSKSEQSVQNFSPSKVSRYTVQRLSNLLSFISPTYPLSSNNFPPPTSFLQHTQQFVQDLTIANLGITNFRGLENLRTFANEFSIWNNPSLTTIAQLGANLPPSYRTSIRNLAIRDNPLLADVGGLRILSNITGR